MATGLFNLGTPRISLFDASGNRLKTLFLPEPDRKDGLSLEWVEKGTYKDILDGSEAGRRKGWIPVLTLGWSPYAALQEWTPHPIGDQDGNMADITTFLALLDNLPKRLRISPGPTAGGFRPSRVTVAPFGAVGRQGLVTGLRVTFRGSNILSSKVLEVF